MLTITQQTIDQQDEVTPARTFIANWRSPQGKPLVEQFRISGLGGDDVIEFVTGANAVDVSILAADTDDWISVIDGGPGNDVLRGTGARDRLDGGSGDDLLFGMGGDDRLWGDGGLGATGKQRDVLFAGQGNDDLIGGPGENLLFAWSFDPYGPLHFADGEVGR